VSPDNFPAILDEFRRESEGVFLDTPFAFVKVHEGSHGVADIIDGPENPAIDGRFILSAILWVA